MRFFNTGWWLILLVKLNLLYKMFCNHGTQKVWAPSPISSFYKCPPPTYMAISPLYRFSNPLTFGNIFGKYCPIKVQDKQKEFTCFFTSNTFIYIHIWPKGHREPHNKIGSLRPVKHLVGFEPRTLWFWSQWLNKVSVSALIFTLLKTFKDIVMDLMV